MLILNKSFDTIQQKAEERFNEVGINTTQGSIARLFSSVINEEVKDFYETLQTYHLQSFVTTATGTYLDSIGKLLDCQRYGDESDENYRYRITKQILNVSSANLTAIKLAAFSIDGVDSVVMLPHTKGSGSFTMFVVSENGTNDIILNEVREKVSDVVGYGINFEISEPSYRQITLRVKVLFKNSIEYVDKDEILERVRKNIIDYINSLAIGEEFVLNKFTTTILNTDKNIANYICDNFTIDGKKCILNNQYIKNNEKFVINDSYNSIILT